MANPTVEGHMYKMLDQSLRANLVGWEYGFRNKPQVAATIALWLRSECEALLDSISLKDLSTYVETTNES